jgi:predicted DNA-binding protein (MmcQ/YjbR family)
MFCVTGADSTGGVSFKCAPEKFAELTERPGIVPAAYVARYHWVTVEDSDALPKNELKDLIKNSYDLVYQKLPKGVRSKLA